MRRCEAVVIGAAPVMGSTLLPWRAGAVDGVIEINQTRVLAGGGRGVAGTAVEGVTVRNGTIRGTAGCGICLVDRARGENVRVIGNGNNAFTDNTGGNANPQVGGGVQLAPNLCGTGLCP